jgi:hypothetical protein
MNDPLAEIEAELRQTQPARPNPRLVSRIEQELARSLPGAPSPERWRPWLLWAPLGAATTTALAWALFLNNPPAAAPTNAGATGASDRAGSAVPQTSPARFQQVQAANYFLGAEDDGVVYASADTPVRKVRYRFLATSQWKGENGRTTVEVIVPGEETVLLPMDVY